MAHEDLVAERSFLRVVPGTLVAGDSGRCSNSTCWLGRNGRASTDLRRDRGIGEPRFSQHSYRLVPNSTSHANYKGSSGDLIDERILRVIRALSVDPYFYVVWNGTHYCVVPMPPAPWLILPEPRDLLRYTHCEAVPKLPCRPAKLGDVMIVWLEEGLSLLLRRVDLHVCPSSDDCRLRMIVVPEAGDPLTLVVRTLVPLVERIGSRWLSLSIALASSSDVSAVSFILKFERGSGRRKER